MQNAPGRIYRINRMSGKPEICYYLLTWMCRRSVAMRFNAVLSSTTTQSAQLVSRRRVSRELYGWTTTSLESINVQQTENKRCLPHISPDFVLIGKHAVRLDQLLRESVRQSLHNVRTHSRSGPAGDRMAQHESLKTVAAVRLAIDNIEHLLLQRLALAKAGRPVVARATAILGYVNVLRVVQLNKFNMIYISCSLSNQQLVVFTLA